MNKPTAELDPITNFNSKPGKPTAKRNSAAELGTDLYSPKTKRSSLFGHKSNKSLTPDKKPSLTEYRPP